MRHAVIDIVPILVLACVVATAPPAAVAQQVGDPDFTPDVSAPAYASGAGPVVAIDAAHYNFHTVDGRYQPLAELLRGDGYTLTSFDETFSAEALSGVDVLVVANALGDPANYMLPTLPAFTDDEIEAVHAWVSDGGALWLVADHMPWPGAAEGLAARFGVYFHNGYAESADAADPLIFRQSDGTLTRHPITQGRTADEDVPTVATFMGQAFRLSPEVDAAPLMVLGAGSHVYLTQQPGLANAKEAGPVPLFPGDGLAVGVALTVGEGRVAMFGEAAMFSAQVDMTDDERIGMNSPDAPHNAQFAVNVAHWLSGVLDDADVASGG